MIELKLISEFPHEIIAVDEVGRSPLSGPVVIGAVRLMVTDPIPFATKAKWRSGFQGTDEQGSSGDS